MNRRSTEDEPRRAPRSDARRSRAAIVAAAARELKAGRRISPRELAAAAEVSRSTVYRHFPTEDDLLRGLAEATLEAARAAIRRTQEEERPLFAGLKSLVNRLVEVGDEYPFDAVANMAGDDADDVAPELLSLAERLGRAADLAPAPPPEWSRAAAGHLVEACLALGSREHDSSAAAESFFNAITDTLDRGLVLLDPEGRLISLNSPARQALAPGAEAVEAGKPLTVPTVEVLYEEGSACPADAYPLRLAVQAEEDVIGALRGHRSPSGDLRWFSIDVRLLRRFGGLYGVIGIYSDVTEQRRAELSSLRPPGELARASPVPLDVGRALDEVPAPLLPEQIVAEAMRLVGVPVALYVVDIDGSHLLRLAGAEHFPARLRAPLALGPEIAEDGIPELRVRLEDELPGVAMVPMWLRGRALGLLLALRVPEERLLELARQAASAIELAGGYTDVIDGARRRKEMNPAAEIQQSLLPPRISRLGAGEVGGSVLPSYDVGGDWFDYVENRDGAWIAIADAAGKGPVAGGLGSVALAALRAARRNESTLEEAAQTMNETIHAMEMPEFFVTAVLARWEAVYSVFSWVNCGHPPPLLCRSDGTVEELSSQPALPLGLLDLKRRLRRSQRRLEAGERVVLYSDGISMRPTREGRFGPEGIAQAIRSASGTSATATARAIQEAVVTASSEGLRDDAAVVVLAPYSPD
ncbi:MAG TPA: SpoIIE family protein phosphatase [Thermoleophilaceae bacterium]|nr:SpoIIE family protein phosphatase [Thermoleophilaceae bacterium]